MIDLRCITTDCFTDLFGVIAGHMTEANSDNTAGQAKLLIRPTPTQASLPDDHRVVEPPDPLPNSEVKRNIADGSVGFPHVRVGHRQASNPKGPPSWVALFLCVKKYLIK